MEHLFIDCTTGNQRRVPLTAQEISDRQAAGASADAAEKARRQQRDADVAAIRARARTDADFAALARILGLP